MPGSLQPGVVLGCEECFAFARDRAVRAARSVGKVLTS